MKNNEKFKKLLLLKKDNQEDSIFRIIDDEYWEEIEFDAIPILLEKIKTIKNKYIYSISIPVMPGMYVKMGEIQIPIELDKDFLKIFEDNIEKIRQIEQILHLKSMRRMENLFNKIKKD
jgi:hypothetical protein